MCKGGVSSPYGGAKIDVQNVYSHDNISYGIYADSDSTHPLVYARISNCLLKNNGKVDLYVADGTVIDYNNIYDTSIINETATLINPEPHVEYAKKTDLSNMLSFDKDGNLVITINGVTKKFSPIG